MHFNDSKDLRVSRRQRSVVVSPSGGSYNNRSMHWEGGRKVQNLKSKSETQRTRTAKNECHKCNGWPKSATYVSLSYTSIVLLVGYALRWTKMIFFFLFFLFSFLLFPSHLRIIFALLFSLPPSRNSDPGSHSRLFSPPTHYGSCLAFLRRKYFSSFFPRRLASIITLLCLLPQTDNK